MFNKQYTQMRIDALKEQAENAKEPGVKAVLLLQARKLQNEMNQHMHKLREQYWIDLEAKYASAEAASQFESTVVTTDPELTVEATKPRRGRKAKGK